MKFLLGLFIVTQFITVAHADEAYQASLKLKASLEYKSYMVPMVKITGKNVSDIIKIAAGPHSKHQKIYSGDELYGLEGNKFSCYNIKNERDAYCVFYVDAITE